MKHDDFQSWQNEWLQALIGIRNNPLHFYTSLSGRRSRMRLAFWRRGVGLVLLLGVGLFGLYMWWVRWMRASMVGRGLSYIDTSPAWVDFVDYLLAGLWIVLPVWLAVATFDAVRHALASSLPGNGRTVDDVIALGKLTPAEILLGLTWGPILRTSGIAYGLLVSGPLMQTIGQLIAPFRGEMQLQGLSGGFEPPPAWLDGAMLFAQAASGIDLDWVVALMAENCYPLFVIWSTPVLLVLGLAYTFGSVTAIVMLSVCLGARLGPHLGVAWAGLLAIVQLIWPLANSSNYRSSAELVTAMLFIGWLSIAAVLVILVLIHRFKSCVPIIAVMLMTLVTTSLGWAMLNGFAIAVVLQKDWQFDNSLMTGLLDWLIINRYSIHGWPNPFLWLQGSQYEAKLLLEFAAESIVVLRVLLIATLCTWFARNAVHARLRPVV